MIYILILHIIYNIYIMYYMIYYSIYILYDIYTSRETAARYARTWMLPDLVVIVVDWVMLSLALTENDSGSNPAGFARIGKSVRYMRPRV